MFLTAQTVTGVKDSLASQCHSAGGQPSHSSASASFVFETEGCQQVGGSLLDCAVYEFIRTLKVRAKLTRHSVIISMVIERIMVGVSLFPIELHCALKPFAAI